MRKSAPILLLSIAILGFTPGSHAGVEPEFKTRVSVTLRDEKDQPVPDADVSLLFSHVIDARSLERKGRTDLEGKFGAEEKIISSLMITVAKDGFHPIHWDRALIRTDVDAEGIKEFDAALQLRRRIHPEALHAKRVSTSIPAENSAVGFDLKAGDWVKPFGQGTTPDFSLRFRREFTGYRFTGKRLEELREFSKAAHEARGETWTEEKFKEKQGKWRGELILSLAGKEEGIATVEADYHPYSGLRMPHLAYESGYQATLTRKEETFTPVQSKPGIGYFLRSRVRLDEAGKIVSANYAKIIEDIVFDARGRVEFTYIFNPTPNDRNLEFDPARNLFGELPDDQQVRTP
jgi:hypothetical protein